MKRTLITLMSCAALSLPLILSAAEHGEHQMNMEGNSHASMEMMGHDSIMLGQQTVEGVSGMAHLNDVGAVMAKMGKEENYHFMMMFSDANTGNALHQGTVAVKITGPGDAQAGAAIPLMGMGAHFGADVALLKKGEYHFTVGTKLSDGQKRRFEFSYTVQ